MSGPSEQPRSAPLERVSRLRAFSTHLAISAVIFTVLAVAMVTHWFPGPYFVGDGGWQGMRIIAAVDLVLGPALTLIFFNPKSKKQPALLFDLCAIATVQVIALVWGIWTVYNERTVAIAYTDGHFYSVSYGALTDVNAVLREADRTPVDIYSLSDTHPRQVYVRPLQPDEFGKYVADIFNGLPELQLRTDRYEDITQHWQTVDEAALDIREFAQQQTDLADDIAALENELDVLRFYPMTMRFGESVVAFNRETRQLAHIINYQPVPVQPQKGDGNESPEEKE